MKSDSGKRQKTRHSVLGFVSSLAQSCPLLFLSHPTCQLKNKQLSACVSIADLQGVCCIIMNTQDSRRNKKTQIHTQATWNLFCQNKTQILGFSRRMAPTKQEVLWGIYCRKMDRVLYESVRSNLLSLMSGLRNVDLSIRWTNLCLSEVWRFRNLLVRHTVTTCIYMQNNRTLSPENHYLDVQKTTTWMSNSNLTLMFDNTKT